MAETPTILLFRPEPEAAVFAAALEARLPGRFRAVAAPVFDVVPVGGPLDAA